MLQLRVGDASGASLHMQVDDSYLRRIEPGSPLARKAALTSVCHLFPNHTVPGLLDAHAAAVLCSQWSGGFEQHAQLDSVCRLLEGLGHRAHDDDESLANSPELARARAVAAMMIWQRFASQSVQRLAGSLEAGHDFPCAGTDVAKNLGICARIVALFEPALPGADELGNRVDAIMEKLDSALSEAPPIVAGSDAGGMPSDSEADVPAALQTAVRYEQ